MYVFVHPPVVSASTPDFVRLTGFFPVDWIGCRAINGRILVTNQVRKYYCASHSEIIPNMIQMTVLTSTLARTTITGLIMALVLAGCSMFGNKAPEYLASQEAEPLKIPEGLDKPRGLRPVVISVPPMRMPAG